MQTREFVDGKDKRVGKIYFIKGQIQNELKLKKDTHFDTVVAYYSTGKVKQMRLIKNNAVIVNKKADDINYYIHKFYQSLNAEEIVEANKSFFKIWKLDSAGLDTHFMGGILMLKEHRFDKAITEFDNALRIEPLMREALVHRILARIKKHQSLNTTPYLKSSIKPVTMQDLHSLQSDDQNKICHDLQQAVYVDFSESYVKKMIPIAILNYCRKMDRD